MRVRVEQEHAWRREASITTLRPRKDIQGDAKGMNPPPLPKGILNSSKLLNFGLKEIDA